MKTMRSKWDRIRCSKMPCLISPLFFEKKESVEICAKKVYQYFVEVPCADYKVFHEWALGYSKGYAVTPNQMQLTVMEQLLEFAGLVPRVYARLLSEIDKAKIGGAGYRTIAKQLGIKYQLICRITGQSSCFLRPTLYFDFEEKYLKNGTPSIKELVDALIRHRKDFNRFCMDGILQEFDFKKGSGLDPDKLYKIHKQKLERQNDLIDSWINWDGEIDVYKELDSDKELEEIKKLRKTDPQETIEKAKASKDVDDEESDDPDVNAYDAMLESQVITPPAWYIEKVWGEYKLPGIHLPADMWDRYLSIYEKKEVNLRWKK